MRLGASLLLIAIGAILKFAVTKHFDGLDIQAVGVILLIIGIVGLLFELIMWGTRRRTTVVSSAPYMTPGTPYVAPGTPVVERRTPVRTTYVEPNDPLL
jgi:hypothetical protein